MKQTLSIIVILFFISCLASPLMSMDKKHEEYRKAIKAKYSIDIKDFKDQLKGGLADKKKITDFNLKQILLGIEVEMEHTSNKLIALEITMDHLAEIKDYYTHLIKMEEALEGGHHHHHHKDHKH